MINLQLGQPSVNPPRLVLEVGGDFNLAGSCACKVEVPPTSGFQVGGGTSALQAWLPAKLKSPPLQAQVWGGVTREETQGEKKFCQRF